MSHLTLKSMTSVATCMSPCVVCCVISYCIMYSNSVVIMFETVIHRVYPDGKRIPVNRNNLLLRGCVLRNTESAIGIVVYAGVCVRVHVCVYVCACVCACVYMYVHACVCLSVCMCY